MKHTEDASGSLFAADGKQNDIYLRYMMNDIRLTAYDMCLRHMEGRIFTLMCRNDGRAMRAPTRRTGFFHIGKSVNDKRREV